MSDIEQQLTDATKACLGHYKTWNTDKKNRETREVLEEALHDLRRVCARLEIEMAVSERDQTRAQPIPIPAHRSARRGAGEEAPSGNVLDPSEEDDGPPVTRRAPRRRRTAPSGRSAE